MIIDAHHHFWVYDTAEFGWIDDNMRTIRRNFLPEDLEAEAAAAGIDGVVSVQARQTVEETDWLLDLARSNDLVQGVVGWLPLASKNLKPELDRVAHDPKLKGVRHVVQDEAPGFLDDPEFNRGIGELKACGLVYDLLLFEHQLVEAIRFVDRHPSQSFVVDHIAKPQIKLNRIDPWRENIHELAKRDNVTCKISGMATEADYSDWTESQLQPYVETVLEAFGPKRLMFGSDWPVCLVAVGYRQWIDLVRECIAPLSSDEQVAILSGTATKIYHL
ncbi:amidohydrolase family protein [Rubripirellula amarantea]|nr:amidohydrolase family protein [Rubripirellula amarantea]